jgi:hypothetical protein
MVVASAPRRPKEVQKIRRKDPDEENTVVKETHVRSPPKTP